MDHELIELYRKISKLQKRKLQCMLKDYQLYVGQPSILHAILRQKQMTLTQLVKETNTSKESMSVSIKRLEKAGFVYRFPDNLDGRVTWIGLTEKGEQMADLCRENYHTTSAKMFSMLSDQEKIQLEGLFKKMIMGLEGEKHGVL